MAYLRQHTVGPVVPAMLAAYLADVEIEGAKATAEVPGFSDVLGFDVRFDKIGESWIEKEPVRSGNPGWPSLRLAIRALSSAAT